MEWTKNQLREAIIPILEEALQTSLNEKTVGAILDKDPRLAKLLEAVGNKKQVIIGEAPEATEKVSFSQWLGDLARIGKGQNPIHCKKPESFIGKALYEGSDSVGGYLVPQEQMRQLLDLTANYAVIEGLCQRVPMNTNQIIFPTMTSGLTAYWIPETTSASAQTAQASGAKQESTPTLSTMTITVHVLAVLAVVSNQLLDDSDPSIEQVLMNIFGKTLGKYFDLACLAGTGASTDPVYGLDSLVTTNVLTAGAEAGFKDIVDLIYPCLDNVDGSTTTIDILGHTKAERTLLKVTDNEGQFLYKRPADARGIATLWGEPFHRDNNITTVSGANSDKTKLYAGDFLNYGYVGVRNEVSIRANPWGTGFRQNQTEFLAEFRKGFQVSLESAFAIMSGWPTA